jgi:hypothetical protein
VRIFFINRGSSIAAVLRNHMRRLALAYLGRGFIEKESDSRGVDTSAM